MFWLPGPSGIFTGWVRSDIQRWMGELVALDPQRTTVQVAESGVVTVTLEGLLVMVLVHGMVIVMVLVMTLIMGTVMVMTMGMMVAMGMVIGRVMVIAMVMVMVKNLMYK